MTSDSELAERRLTGLGVGRSKVAAIQRSRILAATVCAIDELGYADISVAGIVARARVSRRTFYELFANREECVVAVLDETIARVAHELDRAEVQERPWRERVRLGMWTILRFLEREPALARVCVVQALGGGAAVRARREEILSRLAVVVDEGRYQGGRGGECAALTAEGLVGAAYMIVATRLANGGDSVSGMLGELTGLIVLPYLGPAAARRERARRAPSPPASDPSAGRSAAARQPTTGDPLQGITMRLTYRTTRVLEEVGEHPGASNRQLAEYAGIGDPGQVSKLLRRLERLGLLENRGRGHARGEQNEWFLSGKGALVTESIRLHVLQKRQVA